MQRSSLFVASSFVLCSCGTLLNVEDRQDAPAPTDAEGGTREGGDADAAPPLSPEGGMPESGDADGAPPPSTDGSPPDSADAADVDADADAEDADADADGAPPLITPPTRISSLGATGLLASPANLYWTSEQVNTV